MKKTFVDHEINAIVNVAKYDCDLQSYEGTHASMIIFFCENSYRLLAVNNFSKKSPSMMPDRVLNPSPTHYLIFVFEIMATIYKITIIT